MLYTFGHRRTYRVILYLATGYQGWIRHVYQYLLKCLLVLDVQSHWVFGWEGILVY